MTNAELRVVVRETIEAVFDERKRVDEASHQEDHAFIRALIEKEKRRQEIWEKSKAHVIVWAITGVLGYLAMLAYQDFSETHAKQPIVIHK